MKKSPYIFLWDSRRTECPFKKKKKKSRILTLLHIKKYINSAGLKKKRTKTHLPTNTEDTEEILLLSEIGNTNFGKS